MNQAISENGLKKDIMNIKEKSYQVFSKYFDNLEQTQKFVDESYQEKKILINTATRLISLSDDITYIRPKHKSINLLFLVICIESLYKIANTNIRKKTKMIIDFFDKYIDDKDKQLLITRFRISIADDRHIENINKQDISLNELARVIYEIRCNFIHEGDFYSFTFSGSNDDYYEVQPIKVRLADGTISMRVYETLLNYNELRDIFIKGFINFIKANKDVT